MQKSHLNSILNIDLLIKILSLTLLYILAGKAGQVFSLVGGTVSLIWLPSGIALSAMLIFGRKLWAGIFLGVFLANISNDLPLLTIIGMGIGSSLGAIAGSLCLEKIGFQITLTRTYDIFLLIIFGGIVNPIVSSLIDIPALFYSGIITPNKLPEFWLQFILGDALGVLLMTPSLLILSQYPQIHNFNYTLKQIIEYISILILLSLLCVKIFLFDDSSFKNVPNIPIFVIFIFIVWLSLRFRHLGTAITILIVSLFSLWGTAHQLGPLTQQNYTIMMFNLWFFIVTISLVGFVITVVIFELTESENKAKKIAIVDELTQLYNRRYFNTIFPEVYNQSKGKIFAFLLIDIDNFKKYNDTYGHQEGDKVLIKLGQVLKQYFQELGDFSFRLGGEEFAGFILVNSIKEALFLAENLKENIENLKIEHKNNPPFNLVTISIGLKVSYLNFNENQETIYQQADQALYQAKTNGRNCICIYSD